MAEDDDDTVIYRADYSRLWEPPLLPPRPPWALLAVVAAVMLSALVLAMGD